MGGDDTAGASRRPPRPTLSTEQYTRDVMDHYGTAGRFDGAEHGELGDHELVTDPKAKYPQVNPGTYHWCDGIAHPPVASAPLSPVPLPPATVVEMYSYTT